MKAATAKTFALVALLAAACGAPAGSSPASTPATLAPATPSAPAVTPSPEPTPEASPTAMAATELTADDEQIAELIRSISAEATPKLDALKDMSLDDQLPALMPVPKWVNDQKVLFEAFTASSCTEEALLLFFRGIDRYSDVAEKFLAWREWGVVGDPYPRNMPLQAIAFLDDALEALDTTCPR